VPRYSHFIEMPSLYGSYPEKRTRSMGILLMSSSGTSPK
jgi:hypothetical protein